MFHLTPLWPSHRPIGSEIFRRLNHHIQFKIYEIFTFRPNEQEVKHVIVKKIFRLVCKNDLPNQHTERKQKKLLVTAKGVRSPGFNKGFQFRVVGISGLFTDFTYE